MLDVLKLESICFAFQIYLEIYLDFNKPTIKVILNISVKQTVGVKIWRCVLVTLSLLG